MTDRRSVLVHIHVSQGDGSVRAGSGSVKAVVGAPGRTLAVHGGHAVQAAAANGHRCWAVAFHGRKYVVFDAGAKGITITRDAAIVWTGRRAASGAYETASTTVPHDQLARLLRRVGVGDARTPRIESLRETPKASSGPRSLSAPTTPSSRTAENTPLLSAAQAASLARGRAVRAERLAAERATTHSSPPVASKPPRKRATTKRIAAHAAPVTPASRAGGARSAAGSSTAKATPAAGGKRKPGRPRKPRAATPVAAAPSTRTDRAPPTTRSRRHPSVDDLAVLAEVKKKVKRDDPDNAASLYDALERIWFAGGKEQTLAWMRSHKIATVVEAFSDWVDKHADAARRLLEKAPRSRHGTAA